MGLDIEILKCIKQEPNKINVDSLDVFSCNFDIYPIWLYPELKVFKEFIFTKTVSIPKFQEYFELYGYEYKSYKFCDKLNHDLYMFENIETKEYIEIYIPDVFDLEMEILVTEKIGWQRNGVNQLFYKDTKYSSPCITSKEVLEQHWKTYFSNESENNFKTNIVDKFKEGETFVHYC